jgi:hypothetical protein
MLSRCVPLVVAGMLSGCGSSSAPLDAAVDERPPPEDGASVAEASVPDSAVADAPGPGDAPMAGDAAPVGSCGLTACGGALAGGWNVTSTCYGPGRSLTTGGCPRPRSTDSSALATTGTMTFNADGTYSMTFSTSGPQVVAYDFGCSDPSPATCADLQAMLQNPADHTSAACSQAGTLCTCTVTYQGSPDSEEGTYVVDSKGINLSAKGFTTPYTRQFCVAGATMKMTLPLAPGGDSDGVHSLSRR